MKGKFQMPSEDDNIDCHLQQVGMGGLVCRAAKQSGDNTTNEVNPTICFNCPAGKIYREVGCDAVLPNLFFFRYLGGASMDLRGLFCTIRKRETSLEYCRTCDLASAETTRRLVTTTTGIFQSRGFHSAYKDIEEARKAIRDGNFENAVTRSIASLESVMRICHEKLTETLPPAKTVTDLWKSTRSLLQFDKLNSTGATLRLVNTLSGVITHLGNLRNSLSDAHGKGTLPPVVSAAIAELAVNTASTMSTVIVRRFNEVEQSHEQSQA